MGVVFSHYLFIYAVLHEAVSSSKCLSSNDMIISEELNQTSFGSANKLRAGCPMILMPTGARNTSLLQKRQHQLHSPLSLLLNWYRPSFCGVKWPDCEVDN